MEISFKQELYIVVQFEDVADRAIITTAVREAIEPEFERIIKKIKLENSDKKAFKKLSGITADIRFVPKREYLEQVSKLK